MDVETASATATLGEWVSGLRWADVPHRVRQRLRLVLLDVLGVACLGATDPAQQRFVDAWAPSPGPSPVFGAGVHASVEAAAWLNATALVRLELDEGNKFAKGHPAAHGFPAVLALASAQQAHSADVLVSLLAAYEVAARYGRATRLRAGMHPHGSWGVVGAAAGCARLLRLDGEATAGAIDAAAGMPIASHFSSALDGNRVRDAWMGASNVSGLNAARLAAAGLASNTGTAALSLGELLGAFDPQETTSELGTRWDIEHGYFKRHAACSFTHPAADAVLALRESGRVPDPMAIDAVTVDTHSLAVGLDRQTWDNRLSAMFSIPFVVAAALVHGTLGPEASDDHALQDPAVRALAQRVLVRLAPDLDARLPGERPVRVTITAGGEHITEERPNPVGDSDFHPFDEPALRSMLADLFGGTAPVDRVARAVDGLFAGGTASVLDVLAEPLDTEIHAASPPATTPS
jgi:2-methylcitrate dehydratase PrpD